MTASDINDQAQQMFEQEITSVAHDPEANIQPIAASRAVRSAVLAAVVALVWIVSGG